MKIIIPIILLIFTQFLYSEIRTISLNSAVELAYQNNLTIKQLEKDIKIAEAQFNQAFADFVMPGINLTSGFTYIDPDTVDNGRIAIPSYEVMNIPYPVVGGGGGTVTIPTAVPAGASTNQTVFADNYSLGVGVTKTLFAGFRNQNTLSMKSLNLDLAKKKLADKNKEIEMNTAMNFYNLFLLKENIKLTSDLDKSLKDRLAFTKANYDAGLAPQYDLVRADVQYKNNLPNLLKIKNAYNTAKMAFCDSIGLKDYDNIDFIGNLMDSTNVDLGELNDDDVIKLAISNDINLISLDVTLETLKLSRDIAGSARLPLVTASFNYKYDYKKETSSAADRSLVPSWTAGIQLAFPVDGWIPISKTANTISELEETVNKTLLLRQQMMEGIILQTKTLLMQLAEAKGLISVQIEAVKQAKLGHDLAEIRYKAGSSSSLELSDAEMSLNQAQVNYLQGVYNYFSSTLKLKKILGR